MTKKTLKTPNTYQTPISLNSHRYLSVLNGDLFTRANDGKKLAFKTENCIPFKNKKKMSLKK